MPFKSVAQRKYMWAKHPQIARRWTKKYGSKIDKGFYGHMTVPKKKVKIVGCGNA